MRNELAQRLLRELLKDSNQSDRKLAETLNVSQPTISRIRKELEKTGMIQNYTIVPDFKKMGFEILAMTFVEIPPKIFTPQRIEEARKYAAKFPNAIFSAFGEGLGMNGVVISFHKNYAEYIERLKQLKVDWGSSVGDIQSFIVSLGGEELKKFSLTYLKDVPP